MPSDALSTWKVELKRGLRALEERSQLRSLAEIHGVNLCSNDYLGLAEHPELREAAANATVDGAGELMVGTHLLLPSGQPGIVGALLQPPHNDRSLQLLLLSLGWLQLTLSAASLAHNQPAAEPMKRVSKSRRTS